MRIARITKITKSALMSLLFLSLMISGFTIAQESQHKQPLNRSVAKMKKELNLSEEQVKAVTAIYEDTHALRSTNSRKAENTNKYSNYLDLPADSKEYEIAYKKAAELAAENARNRVIAVAESRKKVYMLLDKEQKKKFLEMKQHHRTNMEAEKSDPKNMGKRSKNKEKKAAVE